MHEFWYDYVKPKYVEKTKLCHNVNDQISTPAQLAAPARISAPFKLFFSNKHPGLISRPCSNKHPSP